MSYANEQSGKAHNWAEEPTSSTGYSFEEWLDALVGQYDPDEGLASDHSFAEDYHDGMTPSESLQSYWQSF